MRRCWALLFLLVCAATLCGAREIMLDRGGDATAWRLDVGGEFPGAQAARSTEPDAATGGPVVCLAYDFTRGGNYVGLHHDLHLAEAKSVSFEVRQEGHSVGFCRVRDAGGPLADD